MPPLNDLPKKGDVLFVSAFPYEDGYMKEFVAKFNVTGNVADLAVDLKAGLPAGVGAKPRPVVVVNAYTEVKDGVAQSYVDCLPRYTHHNNQAKSLSSHLNEGMVPTQVNPQNAELAAASHAAGFHRISPTIYDANNNPMPPDVRSGRIHVSEPVTFKVGPGLLGNADDWKSPIRHLGELTGRYRADFETALQFQNAKVATFTGHRAPTNLPYNREWEEASMRAQATRQPKLALESARPHQGSFFQQTSMEYSIGGRRAESSPEIALHKAASAKTGLVYVAGEALKVPGSITQRDLGKSLVIKLAESPDFDKFAKALQPDKLREIADAMCSASKPVASIASNLARYATPKKAADLVSRLPQVAAALQEGSGRTIPPRDFLVRDTPENLNPYGKAQEPTFKEPLSVKETIISGHAAVVVNRVEGIKQAEPTSAVLLHEGGQLKVLSDSSKDKEISTLIGYMAKQAGLAVETGKGGLTVTLDQRIESLARTGNAVEALRMVQMGLAETLAPSAEVRDRETSRIKDEARQNPGTSRKEKTVESRQGGREMEMTSSRS